MATVQRVYNQPSCTLQVSGIATGGDVLSVLTEFRIRFQDYPQTILGGADVLRQLSHVISLYGQSLQKSLPLPDLEVNGIGFRSVGRYSHVLAVPTALVDAPTGVALQPSGAETARGAGGVKAEFNLSTVQLFDLMDVIDQMVADPSTYPDLQLDFDVAAHRPKPPLGAKLLPALVGVVGLAATAGVLYMLPVPKNQPRPIQTAPANSLPVPPKPKANPPQGSTVPTASPTSPSPTSAPDAQGDSSKGDSKSESKGESNSSSSTNNTPSDSGSSSTAIPSSRSEDRDRSTNSPSPSGDSSTKPTTEPSSPRP
ncbi:MAG: DUF4335 domain-containing protein [Pseudanabaenaceae cyanobacterium]|jgi:hypothetical protein